MVDIVEECAKDGKATPFFEFKVYRSPRDKKSVLGYMPHKGFINNRTAHFVGTEFGGEVVEAFQKALAICEQTGVTTLWVNDPDNLFPPSLRPLVKTG